MQPTEIVVEPDVGELSAVRHPRELRALIRTGRYDGTTVDVIHGYAHANLVIVPKSDAFDFLLFCQRNPKPCPLLEVTDPGDPVPHLTAPEADLRTDLSAYFVWRNGERVARVTDISSLWRDDLVAFVIGCSLTFEEALERAGVPFRASETRRYRPMYTTSIECIPAGRFGGPMVVSVRPMTPAMAIRAVQVTSRYPSSHGAPIHIGDPAVIGITDLSHPDNDDGTGFALRQGEVPVFWACGATPRRVAIRSKVEFMITQASGCLFVTDVPSEHVAVL